MRVLRAALVAALLIPAVIATAPAGAVEVPSGITQGHLMPPVATPAAQWSFDPAATDTYYSLRLPSTDDFTPWTMDVRRLSDNALVRTLPSGTFLTGHSYYETTPWPDTSSSQRVTMRDVETGAVSWTMDVPSGEWAQVVTEDWVLTGRADRTAYVIRRADGSSTTVDTTVNQVEAYDHDLVIVGDGMSLAAIDAQSGALTKLPTEPNLSVYDVVLTPGRLFWTTSIATGVLHWSGRDGTAPGERNLPDGASVYGWYGVGDGVAHRIHDFDTGQTALRPFDTATGQLGAPVATNIDNLALAQAGPGQVMVIGQDELRGTVELADSLTRPARVVGMPPLIPRRATAVAFPGTRVLADFGDGSYDPTRGVPLATDSDGSSAWTATATPSSPDLSGSLLAAAGDVVVTQVGGYYTYRVTWPGGERTITQGYAPTLGRGGKVLVRLLSNVWVLEDARTGAVLANLSNSENPVVDGLTLWRGPNASGQLTATNLATGQLARTIDVARTGCTNGLRSVTGRWAHLDCSSGSVAVDLEGVLADRVVSTTYGPSVYGDGFVGFVELRRDLSEQTAFYVLRVRDLGPGGGERTYGPLQTGSWDYRAMPVADDTGASRVAYIDAGRQIHVVDLDWLTAAPHSISDAKAPDLTSFTTTPRVATGSTVRAEWTYADTTDVVGERAAGVASYDVRYQQGPVGGPYGAWVTPPATITPSVTLAPTPGVDTCFSVRARDARGNLSAWSTAKCTVRDGHAPTLSSLTSSPRISSSTTLKLGWSFTDPAEGSGVPGSGVATYDVRVQSASMVGGTYGAWVYRSDWQAMTATSVSVTARKGEDVCFQVRARDRAGRTSAWSVSRCSSPDATVPTLTSSTVGPLVVPAVTTSKVTFSYKATDNLGVKSYDVAYRYASPGKLLSGFVYQPYWQGTASTSVSLSMPAGAQVCFAVRARDAIGNVTPWSAQRCALVPVDDRALTVSGSTSRITSSLALGGTVTRLNASGAAVSKGALAGDQVALVLLKGPGQGTVEVTVGKHVYGRYSLAATTWRREVLYLGGVFFTDATVRVRSVSSAPARIDAIGVRRH